MNGLSTRLDAAVDPPQDDLISERALIATALGSTGVDEAVAPLASLLSADEHLSVRRCAADALRRIGGPLGASALVPALDDEYWEVKNIAAKALIATPVETALPVLAAVATGEAHKLVRSNALEALGEGKDDQWVSVLEAGVKDESFVVMLGALNGLWDMQSDAALEALQNVRRERHGLVRTALAAESAWRLRRRLRRRARKG